MALQANTIKLRDAVGERLGADTFDSYLAELEVVEASTEHVVLRVGATLAREAARRCGPALAEACCPTASNPSPTSPPMNAIAATIHVAR